MFRWIAILCIAAWMLPEVAQAATNRPRGFKTICKTDQTCRVNGPTDVAFGASGMFVTRRLNGTFICNAQTFGTDPNPRKRVKECSIPANAAAAPAPAPQPAPAPTPAPPVVRPAPAPAPTIPTPPSSGVSNRCDPGSTLRGFVDCRGRVVGTSCNGQSESQQPVFTLEEGTVLMNVTLSRDAADGIHCRGNCTLINVVWQDVCEDAATMRGGAGTTMDVIGGSAAEADDKVFQHNGIGSTINIMNFTTTGSIGKLYRSCGDCTGNGGPRRVNITNVRLGRVRSSVAGVNANFGDVARIRNLRIANYSPGKPKVCEEFRGVQKGNGSSQSQGEKWDTAACDVRPTDVSAD